jgi:hypothetical protein
VTSVASSGHKGRLRVPLAFVVAVLATLAGLAFALWKPAPQSTLGVVAALAGALVACEWRPRRAIARGIPGAETPAPAQHSESGESPSMPRPPTMTQAAPLVSANQALPAGWSSGEGDAWTPAPEASGLASGTARGIIIGSATGFAFLGLVAATTGTTAGAFLEFLPFLLPPFLVLLALVSPQRAANAFLARCAIAYAVLGAWLVLQDATADSPQRGWGIGIVGAMFYLALVPIGIAAAKRRKAARSG